MLAQLPDPVKHLQPWTGITASNIRLMFAYSRSGRMGNRARRRLYDIRVGQEPPSAPRGLERDIRHWMEPSPESQFPAPGDTHTTLFGRIVRMNAGTMNPSHTRPLVVRKGAFRAE
jgi:hypothetical protein